MSTAYLNGTYLPLAKANVSALDRGFLFGDGIYEVIPVYNGKLFRLETHLERLNRSLRSIQIAPELDDQDYATLFHTLIEKNAELGPNQVIYLQVTRGADTFRHHNIPNHIKPTVFACSKPLALHDPSQLRQGKTAIVCDDIRWHRCDIKATSLLANILLNQMAKEQQAEEAILLRDGYLTEGASSNVFIVKDGMIMTPPLSNDILGGVTRDVVIDLALQHGIPLRECAITRADLFRADEVWISSSTREIFPITQLNDRAVSDGTVGPLWSVMIAHYQRFIETL